MAAAAPQPATQNQIRAEQLVEDILASDPELGARIHERARKMFGDIKPSLLDNVKKTVVEPEVAVVREQLKDTQAQLAKALERLDARDRKDDEDKTFTEMQRSVQAAVSKYALTKEGEQKMLDWMKENKVYNAEAAAAVVVHNAPPPASSGPSWSPRKNNYYDASGEAEEALKLLHRSPDDFTDAEIDKFLKDPDEYTRNAA